MQKRMYARESLAFNARSPTFLKLFPEYTQIVHALILTRSNSSHGSTEDLTRSNSSNSSNTDSPGMNRTSNNNNNSDNSNNNNNPSINVPAPIQKSEPIPIAPTSNTNTGTSGTSAGTGSTRSKRSTSSGIKPMPSPQKIIAQPPLVQSTDAVLNTDPHHRGSPKQSRSPLHNSQSLDLDVALKEFETASGRRRLERDISGPLLREISRWTGTEESKVVLPGLEIKSVDLGPEDRVSPSNNNEDGDSLSVPNNNTTPTSSPIKGSSPHSDSPLSASADLKLEVRAKMRISFANWPFLQPNKIEGTPEQQREKAKVRYIINHAT